MNPTFTIQVIYEKDPGRILDAMMHVENWSSFQGEGIIPGIKHIFKRTLTLYGKGFFSNLFLSLVAKFLKTAIEKHTQFLVHEVVN